MQAIPTSFDGHKFRSRLEARWALFFKMAGIKYQYEVEGFESPSGKRYLPDFFLPDTYLRGSSRKGVYIEIKPDSHTETEVKASRWFDRPLILFCGEPIFNIWDRPGGGQAQYIGGFECWGDTWDNYMSILKYDCGFSKIEFMEGNYNCCGLHPDGDCKPVDLFDAAMCAKAARFEFGQAF